MPTHRITTKHPAELTSRKPPVIKTTALVPVESAHLPAPAAQRSIYQLPTWLDYVTDGRYTRAMAGGQPLSNTDTAYVMAIIHFWKWWELADKALYPFPEFSRGLIQTYVNDLASCISTRTGKPLSPATVNLRLAAVRKLVNLLYLDEYITDRHFKAIMAVKGMKDEGERTGNWLNHHQAQEFIDAVKGESITASRDLAMLGVALGCGLRKFELVNLTMDQIAMRCERPVLLNFRGKRGKIRTVPIPAWAWRYLTAYIERAGITEGVVFRAIKGRGRGLSEGKQSLQAFYNLIAKINRKLGTKFAPHDMRRTFARLCHESGGNLEDISILLGHSSLEVTRRYINRQQDLVNSPNDKWELE